MRILASDSFIAASVRPGISKLALLCALLLCLVTAHAEVLQGRVISVSDGDTVDVLDSQRITHRVRLSGIDAPELGQGFSQRSKQHLAGLVYDRAVEVEWNKRDRYGRIVGKVLVAGMDACREMVAAGFAWHYKAYEFEQSLDDRASYSTAENNARQGGLGLWHESNPVPPWEYRAWRRTNAAPQSR
jgi:endonuclease YncB( thermonuclease family)